VYHFGRDGSELHHFEHERGRVALLKHLWPDVTLSRLGAGPELIELIEWGMELEDLGDAPPDARQASYTAIRALAYQVLRRCSLAA